MLNQLKLNQASASNLLPSKPIGYGIPKIIHQTYPTKDLPPELLKNIAHLKALNPAWEYRLYDDKDIDIFVKTEFPEVYPYYNDISPQFGVARADLFRYLLIYQTGGVYLDIKSTLSRPLDEVIKPEDKMLLAHWKNDTNNAFKGMGMHAMINNPYGEFQQWHIASVAGHPFLKNVIENVCRNIEIYNPLLHDTGKTGVIKVTGPVAYSIAILRILSQHPHRIARYDEEYGFVYSIYSNKTSNASEINNHYRLFSRHYSGLDISVTKLSPVLNLAFNVMRPLKYLIKSKLLAN